MAPVLIIVLLGISALPPGAAEAAEKPDWAVGDYWVWTPASGAPGAYRNTVAAIEDVTIRGNATTAYRVEYRLSSSDQDVGTGTIWHRVTDLAVVEWLDTELLYPYRTFHVGVDPPRRIFEWPLVVGTEWTTESTLEQYLPTPGETFVNETYRVWNRTTLSTPAGTFDAYGVGLRTYHHEPGNTSGTMNGTQNFYAPAACNYARTAAPLVGPVVLAEYRCRARPAALQLAVLPWLAAAVIIAVVLGILVLLAVRRRRRARGPPEDRGT